MPGSVPVPMMDIGIVRVTMRQGLVGVPMRVRLALRIARAVFVSMVLVMGVPMPVGEAFVRVLVLVPSVRWSQTPAAIHAAPAAKPPLSGSPSSTSAVAAPMNGPTEKYAPVRAVPR